MRRRKKTENEDVRPMTVRIPDDIYEMVKQEAERNGRSMNAELQQVLKDFYRRGEAGTEASWERTLNERDAEGNKT